MKNHLYTLLRWSEKYTKTDMVYLVKNSFWLNLNTVLVALFSFILSVTLAKFVSKDTYGTYQFILSLSAIIGAVALNGMNIAVIQAVSRGFEGVFPKSVKVQIKYGFIPFTFGLIFSFYYLWNKNFDISISIIFIAVLLPLINALNTWAAFLNGKKEFGDYFKYNQIINTIYYLGMIAIVFIIPTSTFLVITNFVLNATSNYIVYKLIVKKYNVNKNYEEEALSFGKKLSLSSILPTIALNIDNIIIFHFLGAASLAVYSFASNIPERLSSLFRPISTIAIPKFSEQNSTILKENIFSKTKKLFLISVIGSLIYILISQPIFKLFFPSYMESINYSRLYVIAVIFNVTSGLPLASIYARRIKGVHILNTIYPIISISILWIGGYMWGLTGIIWAKIISSFILLASSLYLSKSE